MYECGSTGGKVLLNFTVCVLWGESGNRIDPNGMDIYYLNQKGEYILALKENKDDKLFSMDANGRLNGKEITIGDKKL